MKPDTSLPGPPWEDWRAAFEDIFARDFYTNHGPLEHQLDAELAAFLGVRHVVSVVNGTTAWMLVLRALELQGDVVVPQRAESRMLQALDWAGLRPVFAAADSVTRLLQPDAAARSLTTATSALLAPMDDVHAAKLHALARRHGLALILDATPALAQGTASPGFGACCDAAVIDFLAPPWMAIGHGGCIATNDAQLAARLRLMRSFHDQADNAASSPFRMNAKLSEAQASIILMALRHHAQR